MKQNTDKNHPQSLDEFLEQIREEAYCKTELGSRFEKFVKAYLLSDFFGIKFTDVWLWNECPYSHGHDIGDYLSREEKLDLVEKFHDVSGVDWQTITPDKHNDWLNQRNAEFDSFIPLAPETKFDAKSQSFFTVNSLGVNSNRDVWSYSFSKNDLTGKMRAMVDFYNQQVDNHKKGKPISSDSRKIKWSSSLTAFMERGEQAVFDAGKIVEAAYRPFCSQAFYFGDKMVHRRCQWDSLFPENESKNLVICVSGVSAIITDKIPDLHFNGDTQCFPLYWYEEKKKDGDQLELFGMEEKGKYIRHDGVSDFILSQFQSMLGSTVSKEDIFFWVYGALHSPSYRKNFDADLKKQLPRLPLPKDMPTFKKVMKIGRELASLHLNYEDVEPWDLDEVKTGSKVSFRVDKLRFGKKGADEDRSVIVVNPTLSLKGIPQQAYDYVVNGRSALEWIIDRYQIRTDKDSGIVNDPNKWGEEHDNPRYIVDLIEKVVRVSVESAKLIGQIDGNVEKKSKKMEFVYSTEEDIDSDLPMAAEEAEEWKK